MKTFSLLLLFIVSISYAQTDIWSGKYAVLVDGYPLPVDTLKIEKTADLKPEDVAARFESDLNRWNISSAKDKSDNMELLRRFLFDPENEENEYEQFGWTELHKSGKMNCADGGHFFICQTTPNSIVKFNEEESVGNKTGIFGIWLHFGYVELQKIN